MTMQRWEPFKEMVTLRNAMDRLFEDSFVRPNAWWAEGDLKGALALDMYQTANDVVVKASLPGFKPEEVDISVTGDTLSIKAEHKEETETKEGEYFLKERRVFASSLCYFLSITAKPMTLFLFPLWVLVLSGYLLTGAAARRME